MNRDDICKLARDAWLMDKHDCSDDWFVRADIDERNVIEFAALVAAAERAALKAQEPVAWMVYTLDGKSVCVTDSPSDFTDGQRALPLFTLPISHNPLTIRTRGEK